MDKISKERRSANMARIRSKDSKPEMIVRRLLHGLGYRYRLHCKNLPGKPDLVFTKRKAIIFVHGCFWHQHPDAGCKDSAIPKSRVEYWAPKLGKNTSRDLNNIEELKRLGWRVLVIWECETRSITSLTASLKEFLQ